MNINQLMKQAQAMQSKVTSLQEELAKKTFEGSAGAGAVKIIINGKNMLVSVKIDPSLVADGEEIEILEDLIVAAFNDAKKKLDEESESSFGGIMPAGMKLPF